MAPKQNTLKQRTITAFNLCMIPSEFHNASKVFEAFYNNHCMVITAEAPTQQHLDYFDALYASVLAVRNAGAEKLLPLIFIEYIRSITFCLTELDSYLIGTHIMNETLSRINEITEEVMDNE